MKRLSAILSTATLALFSINLNAQVATNPDQIDFGRVKQSKRPSATVTITNESNGSLSILGTSVDCGCVSANLEKSQLAPHGSATATIEVNTDLLNGDVHRKATIHTSDGDIVIPISLSVFKYEEWSIQPPPPIRIETAPTAADAWIAKIKNIGAQRASITTVSSSPEWIAVKVERNSEDQTTLTLAPLPSTPPGSYTVRIEAQTTSPTEPKVDFAVQLTRAHDPALHPTGAGVAIKAFPAKLYLRTAESQPNVKGEFTINGWPSETSPQIITPVGKVELTDRTGDELHYTIHIERKERSRATFVIRGFEAGAQRFTIPVEITALP